MKNVNRVLAFTLVLIFGCICSGYAEDAKKFSTAPKTNNGQKWRIGYYEGGEYIDYQKIFTETVKGMMKLGWIEMMEIPPQKRRTDQAIMGMAFGQYP